MKKIFYTFLLVCPLLFISSCEEEENNIHGCLDSQATNYNSEATIDNNSCCYNCYVYDSDYASYSLFYGVYCGYELQQVTLNGVQLWRLDGEDVSPQTPGAIPQYSSNGQPFMVTVDCY